MVKKNKGLGDSLHNFFTKTGVSKIVKKISKGRDCGCDRRREKLNDLWKYKR